MWISIPGLLNTFGAETVKFTLLLQSTTLSHINKFDICGLQKISTFHRCYICNPLFSRHRVIQQNDTFAERFDTFVDGILAHCTIERVMFALILLSSQMVLNTHEDIGELENIHRFQNIRYMLPGQIVPHICDQM